VIRQQPGSQESNEAKKRIDPAACKIWRCGPSAALPGGPGQQEKTSDMHGARTAESGSAKPGPANNEAPLPASDGDTSLPPPASLAPDTTTAPDPLLAPPGAGTTSNMLPSSDPSASPGASASPAP